MLRITGKRSVNGPIDASVARDTDDRVFFEVRDSCDRARR